jgi:hypothetical protein
MRTSVWCVILLAVQGALVSASGQAFSFIPQQLVASDTVGAEMAFTADFTNLTQSPLTLTFIRSLNELPPGWESSMCLGVCFPSTVDTVATTPEFGGTPLDPGETRSFSLHVWAMQTPGTGWIRMLVMDRRNPSDSIGVLFTATAVLNAVAEEDQEPAVLQLGQNYPNPFNGTTRIVYRVPADRAFSGRERSGQVRLAVYDLLGREIAVLVDGPAVAGVYTAVWDAAGVSSGTYFYRLDTRAGSITKGLVLLR